MGDVAFHTVLVLHLVAVVGMLTAVVLQLVRGPRGPLKILKWVWLPTVGGSAVTGALLWALAAMTGRPEDPVKMVVKIGALVLGSAIAARYHAAERSATPSWTIPTMSTVVVGEVLLSVAWT